LRSLPQLGSRGGGWVALQLVLLAGVVLLGIVGPGWPGSAHWWLKGAGIALAAAGAIVFAAAVRALGAAMTQFPKPSDRGHLVVEGPYAVVRHPIYSGAMLFLVGIALAVSPWMFLGIALLGTVWALKARVEERLLVARYPGYAAYCERTRYRLCPFVY
jgi:protein-S-isoprenylcysteine O-methyltransferase Ste14